MVANKQELENVALHYNRRLSIKLAWFYSEAFNNYFNHTKHDVPSTPTLQFDTIHCQIKMGLSKLIQLPKQILDILEANTETKNSPNINKNEKGGGKRDGNNYNEIDFLLSN